MDLYSEIILDHFKYPHNKGKLKNPDFKATESNPLCGDKLHMEFKLDKEEKIKEIAFTGEGCAISQASASMLTDKLKGKTINEVQNISNDFIFKMLKVEISPGRSKCALLSLITAKKAIEEKSN